MFWSELICTDLFHLIDLFLVIEVYRFVMINLN